MSTDVDVEVITDDDDDDLDLIQFKHDIFQAAKPYKENEITTSIEINDSDSDTISATDIIETDLTLPKNTAAVKEDTTSQPVSFFNIPRNIELLNQCRVLTIKVVDFNKYPWYYDKYKPVLNMVSESPKSKLKIRPVDISTYLKSDLQSNINESKKIKKSQIDFKSNQGLVGLKILCYEKSNTDSGSNVSLKCNANSKTKCKETNSNMYKIKPDLKCDTNSKTKCKETNSNMYKIKPELHKTNSAKQVDLDLIQKNLAKSLNTDSEFNVSASDYHYKHRTNLGKQWKKTMKALLNKVNSKAKETKHSILLSNTNIISSKADKVCNPNQSSTIKSNEKTSLDLGDPVNETNCEGFVQKEDEVLLLNLKQNYKKTVNKLILGTKLNNETELRNVKKTDEIFHENDTKNSKKQVCNKKPLLDHRNISRKSCDDNIAKADITLSVHNSSKLREKKKKYAFDKVKNSMSKTDSENVYRNNKKQSNENQNREETMTLPDTIEIHKTEISKKQLKQDMEKNKKLSNKIKPLKKINTYLRNSAFSIDNLLYEKTQDITKPNTISTETEKQEIVPKKNLNRLNIGLFCNKSQINQIGDHSRILPNVKLLVKSTQNSLISNSDTPLITLNNKTTQIHDPAISKSNLELSKPYVYNLNKQEKSLHCNNVISQPVVSVNKQNVRVSHISNITNIQQNSITNTSENLSVKFSEINAQKETTNNSQNGGQQIETHISNRINYEHRMIPPSVGNHNEKLCASNKITVDQKTKSCLYGTETELTTLPNRAIYLSYNPKQMINRPVLNKNIHFSRYPVMQTMLNNIPNGICHGQTNQINCHGVNPVFNFPPPMPPPPPPYPNSSQRPPLSHSFQPPLPPSPIFLHSNHPSSIIIRTSKLKTANPSHNSSPSPQILPYIYQPLPQSYPPIPPFFRPPPPPPLPPSTQPLPPLPLPSSTSQSRPPSISTLATSSLPLPSITQSIQSSKCTIDYPPKKKPMAISLQPSPMSTSLSITSTATLPTLVTNSYSFTPSHTMSLSVQSPAPTIILHAPSNSLEGTKIIGQNEDGFVRTIAIPKCVTNSNTNTLSPKRNLSTKLPGSGYSPPILPIRTYEEYFNMLAENEKRIRHKDTRDRNVERTSNDHKVGANNEVDNRKRKIPCTESNSDKSKKKIPLEVYKERLIKDCLSKENDVKVKFEPETESLQSKKTLDLDLGYNSDSNSRQM